MGGMRTSPLCADEGSPWGIWSGVRDFEAISQSLTAIVTGIVGEQELISVAVRDVTQELKKNPTLPTPEPPQKNSSGH